MTTKDGIVIVQSKLDPFTSMSSDVMIARRAKHPFALRARVERHLRATCSTVTPNSSDRLPKDKDQSISSKPQLQCGGNDGGTEPRHDGSKGLRKLR